MRVHYIHATDPEEFDKNVNEFIKDKKVIDIKPYPMVDTNSDANYTNPGFSLYYLDCVVMYEEED
ncbi:MAG: hypothetical protein SOW93_07330 [Limosilactobacillus reuteri]|nr:hypothetical protein [Limosilactobacillus reuteri]